MNFMRIEDLYTMLVSPISSRSDRWRESFWKFIYLGSKTETNLIARRWEREAKMTKKAARVTGILETR